MKEYLSRGTYIFPPEPSRRLIVDMVAYCSQHTPSWNPMNVCSYHLQEAGATPVQEIAFALATAIDVLDAVRDSGQVPADRMPAVVASISFFVNAGIRFVEEVCKMRAFTQLWDQLTLERYGVTDPKARRFRYGVQVNSLGLTEAQPENNVQRIVLEALGVTLSKDARARSLQLPAWNEALGLPRPWDQQWSLRIQQVLALETDLLEYDDIFAGSHVIEGRTAELVDAARAELDEVLAMGGAFASIEELKGRLVASNTERVRRIENGEQIVVGVNRFTETAESPLGGEENIMKVDPAVEAETIAELEKWRKDRDSGLVERGPRRAPARGRTAARTSCPPPSPSPTPVGPPANGRVRSARCSASTALRPAWLPPSGSAALPDDLRAVADKVRSMPGGPPRLLVGKPGLDGHSNGAEQIAVAARDAGMEVIYQGIRLTPEQIAAVARDEDVDVVGLSILSGSHLELVPEVVLRLREAGVDAPVIVGGIIPEEDRPLLLAQGVARVYTPKDFELSRIMGDIADLVAMSR